MKTKMINYDINNSKYLQNFRILKRGTKLIYKCKTSFVSSNMSEIKIMMKWKLAFHDTLYFFTQELRFLDL